MHGTGGARRPETVGRWRDRVLAEGIAGLRIRPGRGRRPAFSPLLRRLGIGRTWSRDHVRSPDPAYPAKRAAIRAAPAEAAADPARVVCFLDEVTLHRNPSAAPAYVAVGRRQPLAERSRVPTPNANGAASPCRFTCCRPTPPGSTRSRSPGAGCARRSSISIRGPTTCRPRRRSLPRPLP